MGASKYNVKSALLLGSAGLGSALLTCALDPILGRIGSGSASQLFFQFGPSLIFGGVIAAYLLRRNRARSICRPAGFIAASISAYSAAVATAEYLSKVFPAQGLSLPASFGAGFVGAFIVLGSALLLFGPGNLRWRSLGTTPLWAAAGGLLGTIGWETGDFFRSLGFMSLFVVWHTGVAFCMGLMISREETVLAAESESDSTAGGFSRLGITLVQVLFFAGTFAFLGLQILETVQAERIAWQQRQAARKSTP